MKAGGIRQALNSLNNFQFTSTGRIQFAERVPQQILNKSYSYETSKENAYGNLGTLSEEMKATRPDVLYPGHIPTSSFQKALLAVGSTVACFRDPKRDDMLNALGETTGHAALKRLRSKMLQDPVGRQILHERPVVTSSTVDVDYLEQLPEGTFGKAYYYFLKKNGFNPDARKPVHFVDDEELHYVMLRYRQVHDLFHTVLSMPPHMLGECIVKVVETFQTGFPMCALAGFLGPLRLGPVHKKIFTQTYLPWAIKAGTKGKLLMAVYFEKHWEDDLMEFRKELNIPEPPAGMVKRKGT